jgi:hypothetical protein
MPMLVVSSISKQNAAYAVHIYTQFHAEKCESRSPCPSTLAAANELEEGSDTGRCEELFPSSATVSLLQCA